jgi:hypothetical protein
LHTCATELIEAGLDLHEKVRNRQQEELEQSPLPEALLPRSGESAKNAGQILPSENDIRAAAKSAGQMDLFVG